MNTRLPISPIRQSILTNFVQSSMRRSILRTPAIAIFQRSNAQSPLAREPRYQVATCDGDGLDDCAVCLSEIKERRRFQSFHVGTYFIKSACNPGSNNTTTTVVQRVGPKHKSPWLNSLRTS